MKLQELAAVKANVLLANFKFSWMPKPVEFWMPHMYSDGEWACTLVFSKVIDSRVMMMFVTLLESRGLSWFVHELNGDIAIDVM